MFYDYRMLPNFLQLIFLQVRAAHWHLHILLHGACTGGKVAAEGEPAEGDLDQV